MRTDSLAGGKQARSAAVVCSELLTFKLGHWPHEEVRARNRDFGIFFSGFAISFQHGALSAKGFFCAYVRCKCIRENARRSYHHDRRSTAAPAGVEAVGDRWSRAARPGRERRAPGKRTARRTPC